MKIWLDDIRPPPDDTWLWAQGFGDFIYFVYINPHTRSQKIEIMSFDHDLGDKRHFPCECYGSENPQKYCDENECTKVVENGYTILKRIFEIHTGKYPKIVNIHSANPAGAENIEQFDRFVRKHRRV